MLYGKAHVGSAELKGRENLWACGARDPTGHTGFRTTKVGAKGGGGWGAVCAALELGPLDWLRGGRVRWAGLAFFSLVVVDDDYDDA